MDKGGYKDIEDVPLLPDDDIRWIVRRRSQGSNSAWWAFWLEQLLASLPTVQQSEGGSNGGGVFGFGSIPTDNAGSKEVGTRSLEDRRGDV